MQQQWIRWRPWLSAVAGYLLAAGVARGVDLAPLTKMTASSVAAVLTWLAVPVMQADAVLRQPNGFAYEIGTECLGFAPVAALAGLLLADPLLSWRRARVLLAIGAAVLLLLNVLRLISLFWIGVRLPEHFALAHDALWPLLLTAALLTLWNLAPREAGLEPGLAMPKSESSGDYQRPPPPPPPP